MYEYDTYADARRTIPRLREPLQTLDGEYFLVKIDPLAQTMTFSTSKGSMVNLTTLSIRRVKEILALNRAGQKADTLLGDEASEVVAEPTYRHEEDSITRFDNKSKRSKRSKRRGGKEGKQSEEQAPQSEATEAKQEAPAEPKREGRDNRENREGRERRQHRHERRGEHTHKQEQEATPTAEGENKEQREDRDHQHNNRRRGRGHHRPHRGERRAEGGDAQRHDNPKTE
jgi:hypothetical protein